MKREYKESLKSILNSNKLVNAANPINNAIVADAVHDLKFKNSQWGLFNKRIISNTPSQNQPNIIVVLESPHIDEFDSNGKGKNPLEKDEYFKDNFFLVFSQSNKLSNVNTLNVNQVYSVYLINAIQYQCSLGLPTEYYRDYIFLYYWETMYLNFESRLKNLLNGNTIAIINLCTEGKHSKCKQIFNNKNKTMDYMGINCGIRFMKKLGVKFPYKSPAKNLRNLIEKVINKNSGSIPYTTWKHPSSWKVLKTKLIN